MNVYTVVRVSSINNNTDVSAYQSSPYITEAKKYLKNDIKEIYEGIYENWEDFFDESMSEWKVDDDYFDHYYILQSEIPDYHPVLVASREDFDCYGYNVKGVDDETLDEAIERVVKTCDNSGCISEDYRVALEMIAEDEFGFNKKEE